MGQYAFPKLVEELQVCELVWIVCGGWDVLKWVGACVRYVHMLYVSAYLPLT